MGCAHEGALPILHYSCLILKSFMYIVMRIRIECAHSVVPFISNKYVFVFYKHIQASGVQAGADL